MNADSDSADDRELIAQALVDAAFDAPTALLELVPRLHQDLKRIARGERHKQAATPTLCTTALVNETFLKLAQRRALHLSSRKHFFTLSALVMRQVLTDYARSRLARMARDESWNDLRPDADSLNQSAAQLLDIDDALRQLASINPRLVEVVHCRYFGGYTEAETAEFLEVTDRTVRRDWEKARAWLSLALSERVA